MHKADRFKKYILVCGCALWLGIPVPVQAKPAEKKLDIYMDGKKYDSIKEYKQYRLEQMQIEDLGKKSLDTAKRAQTSPEGAFSVKSDGESNPSQVAPISEAAEIQKLFNKLLEKGIDGEPTTIDPAKIKTILIIPKKSQAKSDQVQKSMTDYEKTLPSNISHEGDHNPETVIPR